MALIATFTPDNATFNTSPSIKDSEATIPVDSISLPTDDASFEISKGHMSLDWGSHAKVTFPLTDDQQSRFPQDVQLSGDSLKAARDLYSNVNVRLSNLLHGELCNVEVRLRTPYNQN